MSDLERAGVVARSEDQESTDQVSKSPMGGKGPSAASVSERQGAFGVAERPHGDLDDVDQTLVKGALEVDGDRPSTQP